MIPLLFPIAPKQLHFSDQEEREDTAELDFSQRSMFAPGTQPEE